MLIFNAVVKLWKKAVVDKATLVLFLAVFILSVFLDISPIAFVVLCAAAGISIHENGGAREISLYLRLFWEFFKTGLFAVGGGMATLPFMYDISDKTGWFTHSMLADMVAVSESTPGPIGVNMATYVGFVTGGIPGSVVANGGPRDAVGDSDTAHRTGAQGLPRESIRRRRVLRTAARALSGLSRRRACW